MRWMRLGLAAAALCSCAVGPDFKTPSAPKVEGYTAEPLPQQNGAGAQKYVSGMDIPGQWWTLFHSQALNELVQQSIKSNPTLQAAQATLRQANENVAAQKGSYSPAVDASYQIARNRDATGTLQPVLSSGAPVYN